MNNYDARLFHDLLDYWDHIDEQRFAPRTWQCPKAITPAAMGEEIARPEGKPRPPSGGH